MKIDLYRALHLLRMKPKDRNAELARIAAREAERGARKLLKEKGKR
ncbi:MAG: hypothetical protein KY468_09620 [Armatimonadetes bacterium]|nr:hypothetical protein [Armatimonadota bacterium]